MYTYNAILIKVVDGDTMDFLVDLGFKLTIKIRIRLLGIDTPEIFHPKSAKEKVHGLQAKLFVEQFLGQQCALKTKKDSKGKYGRYLANFYIKGVSVKKMLIDAGFEKREVYE